MWRTPLGPLIVAPSYTRTQQPVPHPTHNPFPSLFLAADPWTLFPPMSLKRPRSSSGFDEEDFDVELSPRSSEGFQEQAAAPAATVTLCRDSTPPQLPPAPTRNVKALLASLTNAATAGVLPSQRNPGIALLPQQRQPVAALLRALLAVGVAFNITPTGGGKTAMALFIANALMNLPARHLVRHALVLCPHSLAAMWQQKLEQHVAVPACAGATARVLSFSQLTAAEGGGVLRNSSGTLLPTEEFAAAASQGLLLIVDECHKLKNDQARCTRAFRALRECMHDVNLKQAACTIHAPAAVALLMSATPFDKPEHVETLLTAAVAPRASCSNESASFRLGGVTFKRSTTAAFSTVADACHGLAPWRNPMPQQHAFLEATSAASYQRLWEEKGKAALAAAATTAGQREETATAAAPSTPPPPPFAAVNLSVPLKGEQARAFQAAVARLRGGGGSGRVSLGLGAVMDALEVAKVPAFVDTAQRLLDGSPALKCVVMLQHRAAMAAVAAGLSRYGVVCAGGEDDASRRAEAIASFNLPTPMWRVAVLSTGTCAAGVELDDKDGAWPRALLLSPSFHATDMQQALGRVSRVGTASAAFAGVVYCRASDDSDGGSDGDADRLFPEQALLRNISGKGAVLRGTGCGGGLHLDQLPRAVVEPEELGDKAVGLIEALGWEADAAAGAFGGLCLRAEGASAATTEHADNKQEPPQSAEDWLEALGDLEFDF